MQGCAKWSRQLVLDAHGELAPAERDPWRAHRDGCAGCRGEHERLMRVLGRFEEVFSDPALSEAEHQRLIRGIRERMAEGEGGDRAGRGSRPWIFRPGFAATCAAVCLVIISVGIWQGRIGPDTDLQRRGTTLSSGQVSDAVPESDAEIIQHLDMLRNFSTIEKLIQVTDHQERLPAPDGGSGGEGGKKTVWRGRMAYHV